MPNRSGIGLPSPRGVKDSGAFAPGSKVRKATLSDDVLARLGNSNVTPGVETNALAGVCDELGFQLGRVKTISRVSIGGFPPIALIARGG